MAFGSPAQHAARKICNVAKARFAQDGKPVAIKVLQTGSIVSEESRLRFLQEARAASALSHPNIVTIYDVVCDGEID